MALDILSSCMRLPEMTSSIGLSQRQIERNFERKILKVKFKNIIIIIIIIIISHL